MPDVSNLFWICKGQFLLDLIGSKRWQIIKLLNNLWHFFLIDTLIKKWSSFFHYLNILNCKLLSFVVRITKYKWNTTEMEAEGKGYCYQNYYTYIWNYYTIRHRQSNNYQYVFIQWFIAKSSQIFLCMYKCDV